MLSPFGRGVPDARTGRAREAARRRRRRLAGTGAALIVASSLAACGGGSSGVPTLNWYINPDSGGQAQIAKECTAAANGRYRLVTNLLPRDSPSQREQLVRRLAANDSSIDIMSLDPPYIPELAQAGFLAPVPADVAARARRGVVQSALDGSTWNGRLVAVPFWANTQLLWYRKSVAEAAGLDMSKPVTWDQVTAAAESQHKLVGAQGIRSESLTVWLNALIESAGGSIITHNSTHPKQIRLGLTSRAGIEAARIMRQVARSTAAGPGFDTANEDTSATGFEGPDAGFQVNWPFVWPRAQGKVASGDMEQSALGDFGWALYPRVYANKQSAPPYGGINLGIGAFSSHPDLAYDAANCITTDQHQAYYFITNGNPASSKAVYDDPKVLKSFPMAPTIRQSLDQAAPRPESPYYSEISGGIQQGYHPPASIDPATTPGSTQNLITAVLHKERLL